MDFGGSFGIIPDFVLNRNLSGLQLRLYARITQLSNRKGFCFATNEYLADLLNTSKMTISQTISFLAKKKFIKIEVCKNQRKIYPNFNFKEFDNTAINEQKQPLKSKTNTREYKETTEQEKTLKSQDLVLKTEQKTEKSEVKSENKGDLVLKTEKPKVKKEPLKYDLPFFINAEIFENFIKHRQEIKKPMTQNAVNATIKKLCDFHAKGFDCDEILNNSIANGWQGIFEPQQKAKSFNPRTDEIEAQCERLRRKYAYQQEQTENKTEYIDAEFYT